MVVINPTRSSGTDSFRYIGEINGPQSPHHYQHSTIQISQNVKKTLDDRPFQRKNQQNFFYVASALVDSGVNHHSRGEFDKALKAFTTALKTQRLTLGNIHICVAHTQGNIGAVLLNLGRYKEATEALEESLDIKMRLSFDARSSLPNGSAIAIYDTLNNLGNSSVLQGCLDDALSYYHSALNEASKSEVIGSEIKIADTLHNIGHVHCLRNEVDDALVAYTESLQISQAFYGPNNIHVSDTREKVGYIYLRQKRLDESLEAFLEVLRVTKLILGLDHEDCAPSFYCIGLTYEAKGEMQKAWESHKEALDVYKRNGVENESTQIVRRRIGAIEKSISATKT